MVETFTSAGCGGRHRRIVAIALFTLAAVAAAAALGALVGWAGGLIPDRRWALGGGAAIVAVAALRELGVVRGPVPDLKRQVPEHWRRTLPLPAWTAGYGAILGSGFGTYQPAATFWATLCAVGAVGRPVAGAICMAIFGLARGAMVVIPGTRLLGGFARAHRLIRPVNAVTLAIVAAALVPAAAAAAPFPPANGESDPSLSAGSFAFTQWRDGVGTVAVRQPSGAYITVGPGRQPALSGDLVAYTDSGGIRVVRWATGEEILRVDGSVSRPALSGGRLAYVRATATRHRLELRELASGRTRVIKRTPLGTDLGRPSLSGNALAWHETDGGSHRILLYAIGRGRVTTVAQSSRNLQLRDPVVGFRRVAWIVSRAETTAIWVRSPNGRTRQVAVVNGPAYTFGTMAMGQRRLLAARWGLLTGRATILNVGLRGL